MNIHCGKYISYERGVCGVVGVAAKVEQNYSSDNDMSE
jgi:hypothetical protein